MSDDERREGLGASMTARGTCCPYCRGAGRLMAATRGPRPRLPERECPNCDGVGHVRRLPFAPLVEFLGAESAAEVARIFDWHRKTVYDRERDGVRWDEADRLAVRLGAHPYEVWGDAWLALDSADAA